MAPINCILFPASKTKGEEKNTKNILPSIHSVQGKEHQEGENKRVERKGIKINASRLDRGMFCANRDSLPPCGICELPAMHQVRASI
jgi:hypothetical protein